VRVALIPPTSMLYQVANQPVHMVIPEGLKGSVYRNFYKILGLRDGIVIMLDNGAFEAEGGKPLSAETLIQMVYEVDADILVLPDHMGDPDETLQASRNFWHIWEMHHAEGSQSKPVQFMGVVQGQDERQLQRCIRSFCELEEEFETTIMLGLPRWQVDEIDTRIRYRLAEYIQKFAPHAVHLLGMARHYPMEEITRIAQDFPMVLSMDTSAPYIWTYNGSRLGAPGTESERPADYFNVNTRLFDAKLLQENLETLWRWADGNP
jgi:hypothetical protein